MELDIGVADTGGRAQEGRRFELVRRAEPALGKEPLRPDQRLAPEVVVPVERDRLQAGLLEIDLQMILQVLPHARTVGDNVDAVFGQMRGRADARQHQQFRRIDGRGRNDDFPVRTDHLHPAPARHLDAHGAALLDHNAAGEAADHRTIGPFQRGAQIGIGGGPAAALPDGGLHRAEALLLLAVIIVGGLIARLPPGLDKGPEQRVPAQPARHMQRAVMPAPGRIAAMAAIVPVFHPLVIG